MTEKAVGIKSLLACALLLAVALGAATGPVAAEGPAQLKFIEDMGQVGPPVRYHVEGASHWIAFAPNEVAIRTRSGGGLALRFGDAAPSPAIEGLDASPVSANFYFAGEPGAELTDVSVYGALAYRGVYPAVDVRYSGEYGRLDRAFEVGPGADAGAIRIAYGGSTSVVPSPAGGATIGTVHGAVTERPPSAYQMNGATRSVVPVTLIVNGDETVSPVVGAYDASKPLFILLDLDYGALLGGLPATEDDGMAAPSGDLYFTRPGEAPGGLDAGGSAVVEGASAASGGPIDALAATIGGGDWGGSDLVVADGDVLSGTFTNVGLFHVPSGATVFVEAGVPLWVEAEEILVEGTISADGAGAAGGATNPLAGTEGLPGAGPGGGSAGGFGPCVHGNGGGGGAYGGNGGDSSSLFGNSPPPSLGGTAYGDPNPPGVLLGSGGGSGGNYCSETNGGPGGNGGGAVTLLGVRVTVSGAISADGDGGYLIDNPGPGGGGGSGGGIWLDGCLTLDGALLSAAGGDGAGQTTSFSQGGGGGGGGRVKLSGTRAPGSSYSADVSGGVGGPFGTCCDLPSIAATAGGAGSDVDSTADNGGPCVPQVEPSVGGFAVGSVSTDASRAIAGTRGPAGRGALLILVGALVAALGGATAYARRRR